MSAVSFPGVAVGEEGGHRDSDRPSRTRTIYGTTRVMSKLSHPHQEQEGRRKRGQMRTEDGSRTSTVTFSVDNLSRQFTPTSRSYLRRQPSSPRSARSRRFSRRPHMNHSQIVGCATSSRTRQRTNSLVMLRDTLNSLTMPTLASGNGPMYGTGSGEQSKRCSGRVSALVGKIHGRPKKRRQSGMKGVMRSDVDLSGHGKSTRITPGVSVFSEKVQQCDRS